MSIIGSPPLAIGLRRWPQTWRRAEMIETPGMLLNWRVEKMKLSKDKTQLIYNAFLTLTGIPPATFEYRLGNRSALDWVIDQYQVTVDKRSGIVNDPNRSDDPEYIVRTSDSLSKNGHAIRLCTKPSQGDSSLRHTRIGFPCIFKSIWHSPSTTSASRR